MKPAYRGIVVAAVQCALVLSLAGKYAWDRERLPRVWVRAAPYDPNLPIRGRYVSLQLEVEGPAATQSWIIPARLEVQNGRLVAVEMPSGHAINLRRIGDRWVLIEPAAFFIPEHIPDPSFRAPGEELWVEVSVPPKGPPRPIRLGVKKNGILTPLRLE